MKKDNNIGKIGDPIWIKGVDHPDTWSIAMVVKYYPRTKRYACIPSGDPHSFEPSTLTKWKTVSLTNPYKPIQ